MVAGAALGGAAIQGLHAQAKPPVYYVAEIDVTNPDAYAKEYAPKMEAAVKKLRAETIRVKGIPGGDEALAELKVLEEKKAKEKKDGK